MKMNPTTGLYEDDDTSTAVKTQPAGVSVPVSPEMPSPKVPGGPTDITPSVMGTPVLPASGGVNVNSTLPGPAQLAPQSTGLPAAPPSPARQTSLVQDQAQLKSGGSLGDPDYRGLHWDDIQGAEVNDAGVAWNGSDTNADPITAAWDAYTPTAGQSELQKNQAAAAGGAAASMAYSGDPKKPLDPAKLAALAVPGQSVLAGQSAAQAAALAASNGARDTYSTQPNAAADQLHALQNDYDSGGRSTASGLNGGGEARPTDGSPQSLLAQIRTGAGTSVDPVSTGNDPISRLVASIPGGGGSGGAPAAVGPNGAGGGAVTAIDPTNDLRSSVITNAPDARTANLSSLTDAAAGNLANVDRTKLAQQMFDTFRTSTDPQYQALQRQAAQKAAAVGGLGSGQLTTEYGNLADRRQQELATEEQSLISDALDKSVSDQFNKTGVLSNLQSTANTQNNTATDALRGERTYQTGEDQRSIDNLVKQFVLQQQAQKQGFDENTSLLSSGEAGNPAGVLERLGTAPGGLDPATIAQLAKTLGGTAAGTSGGGSGTDLSSILSKLSPSELLNFFQSQSPSQGTSTGDQSAIDKILSGIKNLPPLMTAGA